MATIATESKDNATQATRIAQDAARRYMDESAAISRTYFNAWRAAMQAGLRTGYDLQNAMIQAWRTMFDASCQASHDWIDQTSESVRKSEDATARMVAAAFDIVESTMPKARA